MPIENEVILIYFIGLFMTFQIKTDYLYLVGQHLFGEPKTLVLCSYISILGLYESFEVMIIGLGSKIFFKRGAYL